MGQTVENLKVQGVGHRHRHESPVISQRDGAEALCNIPLHRLKYVRHDRNVVDVDVVSPGTGRDGLGDLLLRDVPQRDEEVHYALIGP